jgi:molybdopterin-guanine dinucleotide biosynthesis protein A
MTPLYGLVLAGGSSTRMKRDKACLNYGGRNQLDRAVTLAARHCGKVFVSVRAWQLADRVRAQWPMLVDSVPGEGPIVGIRSAMAAYPEAAWLVMACDLPFLADAALEYLLCHRDPDLLATAFLSAHDNLPEPLCAVWEPAAAAALAQYQGAGGKCPRKFMLGHAVKLVEPVDKRALDNVNTPEEYDAAIHELAEARSNSKTLRIQYFAVMREQAGRSEENIDTSASTPADLYRELAARYGFTLQPEQLKVAVNGEFSEWWRVLTYGDDVVFIPPVAGG